MKNNIYVLHLARVAFNENHRMEILVIAPSYEDAEAHAIYEFKQTFNTVPSPFRTYFLGKIIPCDELAAGTTSIISLGQEEE